MSARPMDVLGMVESLENVMPHRISTYATAFGWGWGCSCGATGKGTSARTALAAYGYGSRHVVRAGRHPRRGPVVHKRADDTSPETTAP